MKKNNQESAHYLYEKRSLL